MSKIHQTTSTIVMIIVLFIFSFSESFSSSLSGTFYQIPQSEVDELEKFFEATGGKDWYNYISWVDISTTFSSVNAPWGLSFGNLEIIHSDESATFFSANVTGIDHSKYYINQENKPFGNNLSGELPEINLPNLKLLNLSYNDLNSKIPNFNLPNLEQLILRSNNLIGKIPEINLPKLKHLDLRGNNLSGMSPNFNTPKLEKLLISGNQLTGSIPNFNMPEMRELNLSVNELTGPIPDFYMPKLELLKIQQNQISGFIPNFNMPEMIELNLNNNHLTGSTPNFYMPKLEKLSIQNTQISGSIPNFNMPNLNSLYLSNNNLSGMIPNFDLPSLEYIFLSLNKLDGMIPNFSSSKKLKVIKCSNNKLSGIIPNFDSDSLVWLDIRSNKYTLKTLETNVDKNMIYDYSPQDTILPIEYENRELTVTVDGSANEYHWFLGDTKISSTTISSYRPDEEGIYHCEVTNSLLPDLTLSSHTINVLTVGIATEDEDRNLYYLYNFPPYPQPASSEVKIPIYWRLGNPINPDNIKIYNNMGVEIIQENKIKIEESTSINGEVIWDASGVDSGIYFLEIRHGTSTKYVKILLE
jgi:Leucine-rich repeat (LRR) protein